MNTVSEKFIPEIKHEYIEKNKNDPKTTNIKEVAFYDHMRMIPAQFPGLPDIPFEFKKNTVFEGKVYKKGDRLYELYIYIKNSQDKYSIWKGKARVILTRNRGLVHEKDIYKAAYEKYLKFKNDNCKNKDELEKTKMLKDSLLKQQQLDSLKKKLADAQAKNLKLQETVSAFSNINKEKIENDGDATDNLSKHSTRRKNRSTK
jgi:hypothetical protein